MFTCLLDPPISSRYLRVTRITVTFSVEMSASVSPSRVKRAQEKDELRGLNQRLVSYISHVKQLKNENSKLQAEVTTSKEVTVKEVDSIKVMYETELTDARRLLDETAREKARQQIIASKHAADVEELKAK